MTMQVRGPGGVTVRFPDGTDAATIDKVMRQAIGGSQPGVAAGEVRSAGAHGMTDVIKSAGTGIARGAAAIPGMFGDVERGGRYVGRMLGDAMFGKLTPEQEAAAESQRPGYMFPSTGDIRQTAADVTGVELHEPETTAGRYAETVGEFVPSALAGPGRLLGKALRFGVAPGIASEAAGQAFEGTPIEPYARTGAAIVTGGLAALTARPSSPAAALRESLPRNMTQADVTAARALIAEGEQTGVRLTWPEALAQVTGRRVDLTDVQRVLEQSPGGRPIMSEFMAERPGQVRAATEGQMQAFGPQADPVRTGLTLQRASADAITGLRNRINVITRPLYQTAAPTQVNPARFQALANDPLFQAAVREVRADPIYSRSVGGHSDMSVAMFDAVKKRLDDQAGAAGRAGQNYASATYGGMARDVRDTARSASPEYGQALDRQAAYRQGVLEPAEAGPLGRMAETPDIRSQAATLFPDNPVAGSERVVGQTVRRLARRDPQAAASLVRSHLETAFNEATQANVGGANQWGGAKYASKIMGNAQQERNLQAGIEALPAGQLRWRGFQRLMEVLSATGMRQRSGSATEFNRQLSQDMSRGGPVGVGASLATSPGSALTYVSDFYRRFRLGQNTAELARIITTPGSERLFARLLGARTLTDRQRAAAAILLESSQAARHEGQTALPGPTGATSSGGR